MALWSTNILTHSLRNINVLSSAGNRLAVHAVRQLSCVIHLEKQGTVNTADMHVDRKVLKPDRRNLNLPWSIQLRHYAKSKNRPGKGADKHKPEHSIDINSETVHAIVDIEKYEEDLHKVLEDLKYDYIHKLALKTSAGTFDKIEVETEDGTIPLNQIASIRQKNPTLIILNLNQYIKYAPDVMKALQNSGLNLNPQQEGQGTIYVPITKVSHEHREELAKNAKMLFNQAKEKMNQIYSLRMKKMNKDKPGDVRKTIEYKLLQDKSKVVDEAEKLMKAKQKELLGS